MELRKQMSKRQLRKHPRGAGSQEGSNAARSSEQAASSRLEEA